MNKKQYNNIIEHSLQYDCKDTESSLDTARTVFNNMGVALPQGSMKEVYNTISSNEYMGWRKCSLQEAKEAANKGTAAIGISEDKIVILSAEDEEQPTAQTASVLTITDTTPAVAVANLEYYANTYTKKKDDNIYAQDAVLDKPYDPNYPYVNIRTEQQYYTTLNSYSAEVRNDIELFFTFAEIESLRSYLNMLVYKNSTQQEKERLMEDIFALANLSLSEGKQHISNKLKAEWLFNKVFTALNIISIVNSLNSTTVEDNIRSICDSMNQFSHYFVNNQGQPKPSNVTYKISLLKKTPAAGREIKVESSDGNKDIFTIQNELYDIVMVTALANAHDYLIYKIAPNWSYYWE